jgi:hypothetical protein
MHCVSDLAKLKHSVRRRTIYFRSLVDGLQSPLTISDKRRLAYVAIELDNLVVTGLRQFTKSSLLGCKTSSGARVGVQSGITSPPQAAALVYATLNPAGYAKIGSPTTIKESDEISFRDPSKAEKVLISYSATNVSKVQFAMGFNGAIFSEIAPVRHFFAHRAKNTNEKVRTWATNIGFFAFSDVETLMVSGRPSSGVRIIDGWLADAENFFFNAL